MFGRRVKMCKFCRYAFYKYNYKYKHNYFFSIKRVCESISRFVSIPF